MLMVHVIKSFVIVTNFILFNFFRYKLKRTTLSNFLAIFPSKNIAILKKTAF